LRYARGIERGQGKPSPYETRGLFAEEKNFGMEALRE
jgi:hypothetical protein